MLHTDVGAQPTSGNGAVCSTTSAGPLPSFERSHDNGTRSLCLQTQLVKCAPDAKQLDDPSQSLQHTAANNHDDMPNRQAA